MSIFDEREEHEGLQFFLMILGMFIMVGGVAFCEKHNGLAILMVIVGLVLIVFRIELLFIPSKRRRHG